MAAFIEIHTGEDAHHNLNIDYIKAFTDVIPDAEKAKGYNAQISLNLAMVNTLQPERNDSVYVAETVDEIRELIAEAQAEPDAPIE